MELGKAIEIFNNSLPEKRNQIWNVLANQHKNALEEWYGLVMNLSLFNYRKTSRRLDQLCIQEIDKVLREIGVFLHERGIIWMTQHFILIEIDEDMGNYDCYMDNIKVDNRDLFHESKIYLLENFTFSMCNRSKILSSGMVKLQDFIHFYDKSMLMTLILCAKELLGKRYNKNIIKLILVALEPIKFKIL
jgi:hypothetical protein